MLDEVIQLEGPQTIAAFILETVTGTNGILVPPDGYMQGVRELCTKHGILMICDEVMAGFGRTGEWFASITGRSCPTSSRWRRASPPRTCSWAPSACGGRSPRNSTTRCSTAG